MANDTIDRVAQLAPLAWAAFQKAETAGGVPIGSVEFKRQRTGSFEIVGWLWGFDVPPARLLPAMHAIGADLGSPVEAGEAYRSTAQPSGWQMCMTVSAMVEGLRIRVHALVDGEELAAAIAAERLTGVAA